MVNPFHKIGEYFRTLPEKKKYIEVITASLSIPVLLSVVLVNYLNIQDKRKSESLVPTPVVEQPKEQTPTIITIIRDNTGTNQLSGSPTPTQTPTPLPTKSECIKDIGPLDVASPGEGEMVKTNPLEIDINYQQGDYCSVVWSYRINSGAWSEYNDNNILIYNMDSGTKILELRVKSLASNSSKTIKRTFTYENNSLVAATPTVTPTP